MPKEISRMIKQLNDRLNDGEELDSSEVYEALLEKLRTDEAVISLLKERLEAVSKQKRERW